MKGIRIKPVRGTTLAENKDEAAELRETVILPSLERGDQVAIDFASIETATQSFVHALIAEAVRRYGEETFRLLVFRNCGDGVKYIIRTVFEYTLLSVRAQQNESGGKSSGEAPQEQL